MSENNLNNLPYAAWLEKTLQELIKIPAKAIALTVITDTGEVYSNYYNATMVDKLIVAGIVQQDAMYDSMAANGIVEYADEEEEGETDSCLND